VYVKEDQVELRKQFEAELKLVKESYERQIKLLQDSIKTETD